MANKNYKEEEVVRQLNLKHDLNIDPYQATIQMLREPYSKNDCGIKSKGKIDFLVGFCRYKFYWVTKF